MSLTWDDSHFVPDGDRTRLKNAGENAFARHDAVAHFLIYLAVAVALLAYLRHFQQHIIAAQERSDRESTEVEALHDEVLTERAGDDVCPALIERLYLVRAQQAYLPVPFPGVRVAVNAPFGREMRGADVLLLYTLAVARADRYYLSHGLILLSGSSHAFP